MLFFFPNSRRSENWILEKVEYYSHFQRLVRCDPPLRFYLLSLRHEGKTPTSILPLDSSSQDILRSSPLFQLLEPEQQNDPNELGELAASLMGPGPWTFHKDLKLPAGCDQMKFTNKNLRANVKVGHMLKVVMRLEKGTGSEVSLSKKKPALFDIVVQTPVVILSVRDLFLSLCVLNLIIILPFLRFSVVVTRNGIPFLDTLKSLTVYPTVSLAPVHVKRVVIHSMTNPTSTPIHHHHHQLLLPPSRSPRLPPDAPHLMNPLWHPQTSPPRPPLLSMDPGTDTTHTWRMQNLSYVRVRCSRGSFRGRKVRRERPRLLMTTFAMVEVVMHKVRL